MNFTNKNGFPDAIVKALKNDSYNRGECDYSVTQLLSPPRIEVLKARHRHEVEEDAEDALYRLYGQVAHGIIERANENDLAETRFFGKFGEKTISAQIDTLSLANGTLTDFKFSTVWKFKANTPPDPNWVAQLNVQLELLRMNGLDAKALQIVGLIRDYRISEARDYEHYPKAPIVTVPIEVWPRERTQSFINLRIALHESAKMSLPECSADERWAKPDVWAVMKGKRAISGGLQFSLKNAEEVQVKNPETRIEFRPGVSVRCENYCSIAQFCTQFKRLKSVDEKKEEIA
ncbi:MAG: hypothetical protein AB7H97_04015 [Pseudobdellovibrionaceae bacterium]